MILGFLPAAMVDRIGWTLVHSLWQLPLIAALFGIIVSCLRRQPANSRYLVGCFAVLLMVIVPLATFWLRGPSASSRQIWEPQNRTDVTTIQEVDPASTSDRLADGAAAREEAAGTDTLPTRVDRPYPSDRSWTVRSKARIEAYLPWCVLAWLLGVSGLSIRLLGGWFIAQRLKRAGTKSTPDGWQHRLNHLATRLGLRGPIRLLESALVEVPIVVGWLRPVILIPASALTGLLPQQIEALLAHELAHIRRRDYLINLVQTTVETLLFYHPAMWWVSRQVRQDRENCCDDVALDVCEDRLSYARVLATMEELRVPRSLVAAGGSSLAARIRRILGGQPVRVVESGDPIPRGSAA